ncbi:hypothetical protein [Peijinzhouia sedimentorum]
MTAIRQKIRIDIVTEDNGDTMTFEFRVPKNMKSEALYKITAAVKDVGVSNLMKFYKMLKAQEELEEEPKPKRTWRIPFISDLADYISMISQTK